MKRHRIVISVVLAGLLAVVAVSVQSEDPDQQVSNISESVSVVETPTTEATTTTLVEETTTTTAATIIEVAAPVPPPPPALVAVPHTHPRRAARAVPASKPKIKAKRSAPKTRKPSAPSSGGVWDRLAQCESGNTNDGGAPYYGYWQFDARTWQGMGMSGLPNQHSRGVQLATAQRLQAQRGWAPWPGCARKLGLL